MTPASYKCIQCWQVWYADLASTLARDGFINCADCGLNFTSVEDFCSYRPF